ncbi:hypothetical protein EDD27_8068 [Nonomuraea polychroma]|uniref:Uncharacterized protein n=1 Tax=Nonomuraea polychroma TaxID=46176 RepID=A0A438MHF7_9ACTN|nr:hypothetical protein [Nonomuraea polychroma]RVX45280.1 hypothetical protein EDD27_8068 [Nonomuraea polychroma]
MITPLFMTLVPARVSVVSTSLSGAENDGPPTNTGVIQNLTSSTRPALTRAWVTAP